MNRIRSVALLSSTESADAAGNMKTRYKLTHGLLPFTDRCQGERVYVRTCRKCKCVVVNGERTCPFCDSPAPTGPTTLVFKRIDVAVIDAADAAIPADIGDPEAFLIALEEQESKESWEESS